jgi:ABC-type sugar transport system ATPase subunit
VALLEATGVAKAYPGVQALAGVDLAVEPGEVHALLGENGAGKSTLMKVVAGTVTPDAGRIALDGDEIEPGSPEAARSRGVVLVYQELSLVPQLSVGENVLLGRLPRTRAGLVDRSAIMRRAREQLGRVGFDVDAERRVESLGMAERQLVEIAKALSLDIRLMLLDEPTSALSEPEARRLFAIIRELKDQGVAVVYVSHRLTEILEIADRVTVLRDGGVVGTVVAEGVQETELAQMMVGRKAGTAGEATARAGGRENGDRPVVLRTRGLARPPRLKPVDLDLREGEIVGVFGLVGAGRTRLARTLFGLEPATEGTIEVLGEERSIGSPRAAIEAGLGYLGEDRVAGLVPRMSVAANITLASYDKIARGPLVDSGAERELAQRYVDDLDIRVRSLDQLAGTLSGGTQQKVMLARWTCSRARVLVLDDPTRGIDVGAKEEVFALVRRLASEGVATLYFTSELKEARGLADRVLVMSDGRIAAATEPDAPEEELMTAAGGAHV